MAVACIEQLTTHRSATTRYTVPCLYIHCNPRRPPLPQNVRFRSCAGPFSPRWQHPNCPVVRIGERQSAAQHPSEDEDEGEREDEHEDEHEEEADEEEKEDEDAEPSRGLARIGRGHSQTAAEAAASLASALRARGSAQAARSVELNVAVWARGDSWGDRYPDSYDERFVWADQESEAATLMLWRVVLEACPNADDITACLHDFQWAGIVDALLE